MYYLSRDPVRLLVVVKHAGGVADAMNAGVNAAQYPVIGLVDREADFIPELLLRLIRPMLADSERVVAVCGVAPPPPAPGLAGMIGATRGVAPVVGPLCRVQRWNRLLPVPGSCMLVRRDASLLGWRIPCRARWSCRWIYMPPRELSALGWRFAFLAAPVSSNAAAGTWDDLQRQLRTDQRQLAAAGPFR